MLRTYRYEEIAHDLRKRIVTGVFAADERLPSERTLMQQYAVQRDTIRRALTLLETEGWIATHQKRGSFVVPKALQPGGTPEVRTWGAPSGQRAARREAETGVILVVTPRNDSSTALESLLHGLAEALETTGHTIRYFDSQPLPGRITQELPGREFIVQNGIVGVAIWPYSSANAADLEQLRALVPVVLIDRRIPGFAADMVGFDNVAGGRHVTDHLLHLGHRRIGFFGDEVFAETVQQRWRGYATALEQAGIAPDSNDTLFFNGVTDEAFDAFMPLFLAGFGRGPLTAVVCSNDNTALRLLSWLRGNQREIAVTGYGDLLPNYLGAMGLTTVSQPFKDLGRAVGSLLLTRLAEDVGPVDTFQQIDLPVHLIVRKTVGTSGTTRASSPLSL